MMDFSADSKDFKDFSFQEKFDNKKLSLKISCSSSSSTTQLSAFYGARQFAQSAAALFLLFIYCV